MFKSCIVYSELHTSVSSPSKVKVKDHKRHGSPSVIDKEEKIPKKKHCNSNQSQSGGETTQSNAKNPEETPCGLIVKNKMFVSRSPQEVKI